MERITTLDEVAQLPQRRWWPGNGKPCRNWRCWPIARAVFLRRLGTDWKQLLISTDGNGSRSPAKNWRCANVTWQCRAQSSSALWPDIRQVANILKADVNRLGTELELENPYVAGNPIDADNSRLFIGRDDVLRQIEEALLSSGQKPTLVLYGRAALERLRCSCNSPAIGRRYPSIHVDMQGQRRSGTRRRAVQHRRSRRQGAASSRGVELPAPSLEIFRVSRSLRSTGGWIRSKLNWITTYCSWRSMSLKDSTSD